MIAELLTLAALTWQDPSGDAHGAGDLAPPTAEVYSSLAPFDLVEATVLDDARLVVEVRLAGIPDPGGLPNGLTLPVLDVYLDTGEGGRAELLPGPEMAMPAGRGWELALRVHGDDAYLIDTREPDGGPRPLAVRRRGDVLRLETGLARPEEIRDLHALTGVYDPFRSDAWRPLAATPSPWAFASETPAPPVVDLLADDDAAQQEALRAFTLPARRTRAGSVPWLVLMLAGLGVAIVGLGLRRRVPVEGPSGDAEAAAADERGDADAGDADDATVQRADGAVAPRPSPRRWTRSRPARPARRPRSSAAPRGAPAARREATPTLTPPTPTPPPPTPPTMARASCAPPGRGATAGGWRAWTRTTRLARRSGTRRTRPNAARPSTRSRPTTGPTRRRRRARDGPRGPTSPSTTSRTRARTNAKPKATANARANATTNAKPNATTNARTKARTRSARATGKAERRRP